MATRTFSVSIGDTAYTKVGSNVTIFSATEELVGKVRVVVTDVGDAQPNIGETNYNPFDGEYERGADAVDIWMYSPLGLTTIYGEKQ